MAAVYQSMSSTFLQSGLNLAAITATRQLYTNLDSDAEPLFYHNFPTPLQQGAVRLIVFKPLPEAQLVTLAQAACRDVFACLPAGVHQKHCITAACVVSK